MFNALADDDILALLLTNGDAKQQQQQQQQQAASPQLPPAKRFRLDASPAARNPSSLPLSTGPLIRTREAIRGLSPTMLTAEHTNGNHRAPPHHAMAGSNQDLPQGQDTQPSASTQPRVPSLCATNGRFVPPRRNAPGQATDHLQQDATEGQRHLSVAPTSQRYRETLPGCPVPELHFPSDLTGLPQRHAIVPDSFASCVQYKACWTRALQEEIQIRWGSHISHVCSPSFVTVLALDLDLCATLP